MELSEATEIIRQRKMERIKPFLRNDMPHKWHDGRANFLTAALRAETGIVDTENVSSLGYDADMIALIEKHRGGMVLDCGAGSKSQYFEHVYNLEIVQYPSTDILAVGEHLPFKDNTFDAVLSVAVLEHVRDPFRCAEEIVRVLKPGGDLLCGVPFLQPLHGYPHHYFNATPQGHVRLFEGKLASVKLTIPPACHPVFALQWILQSWMNGLDGKTETQDAFRSMSVGDLLESPWTLLGQAFSRDLPVDRQFEIASGTVLTGQKAIGSLRKIMPHAQPHHSLLKQVGDAVEAILGPTIRDRLGALVHRRRRSR